MPGKLRFRLQCQLQSCGQPFWTRNPAQETCSTSCRARLQHARRPLAMSRARSARWAQAAAMRAVEQPTFATVEEAKAARLARERATGQRTHTLTADETYVRQDGVVVVQRGGWEQRGPGHYSNPGADTMGHGFK